MTTNLLTNPSVETNTTLWSATSGLTLSRVNTRASDGSWSAQVLTDGVVTKRLVIQTPTGLGLAGKRRRVQALLDLSGEVGNQATVDISLAYTDASSVTSTGVPITFADDWQRIVSLAVVTNPAKTLNQVTISVRVVTAVSFTFWADNAFVGASLTGVAYVPFQLRPIAG